MGIPSDCRMQYGHGIRIFLHWIWARGSPLAMTLLASWSQDPIGLPLHTCPKCRPHLQAGGSALPAVIHTNIEHLFRHPSLECRAIIVSDGATLTQSKLLRSTSSSADLIAMSCFGRLVRLCAIRDMAAALMQNAQRHAIQTLLTLTGGMQT